MLSHAFENVKNGWHFDSTDQVYKPFYNRQKYISTIHRDYLVWGNRVVIPVKFRKVVLDLLYVSHPGIVKMKFLARRYVWWPNIDCDVERLVKRLYGCQMQESTSFSELASLEMAKFELGTSSCRFCVTISRHNVFS